MKIVYNHSGYEMDQLIQVAKREKNTKRAYLLVNPMQAKHVPVSPEKALGLFQRLGIRAQAFAGERTVVIGFAETATAIGAAVAACFPQRTSYLHTTRETLRELKPLVSFQEEHSHAVDQALYCAQGAQILQKADSIVFVEDELTTGNTIRNFVRALREQGCVTDGTKLAAVSLLNGMKREHEEQFAAEGIAWDCLVKLDADFTQHAFPQLPAPSPALADGKQEGNFFWMSGRSDPRSCVLMDGYLSACRDLAHSVCTLPEVQAVSSGLIRVIGTEEFMFPPLKAAELLAQEKSGCKVLVHATTRSPILPYDSEGYPLKNRIALDSLYEPGRSTYLYNLAPCDLAVVLTDAPSLNRPAYSILEKALRDYGAKQVIGLGWRA